MTKLPQPIPYQGNKRQINKARAETADLLLPDYVKAILNNMAVQNLPKANRTDL